VPVIPDRHGQANEKGARFVAGALETDGTEQFPLNAIAPCSWTPEESQVESCKHQDNANIHCQPFPESVSEEREIYTDYDGCHRHDVEHDRYLPAHFSANRHFEFSMT
jgi:hypothetical protein